MADTVISTEEIKENILKCDRCGLQFDSEGRTPRMLPCQHSYCTACLDDVWTLGNKLNCPSCTQQWDVRGSIAETFPVEFTAMKFVVYLELKSKKGMRMCTDCSEKTTATHHCLNCQVYICEEGLRAHKRFYKQKDHQILSVAEILKLPENYLAETETCRLHPGSTLDLYCEKSTCMTPVCPSCAMIKHKEREGHEIRDLKQVVADEKQSVNQALEALHDKLDLTKNETSELDRDIMYLSIESKRLESNIERFFSEFVRQAAEQKEELKKSLQHAVGDEREHIEACRTAFRNIQEEQENYYQHCQDVMSNPKIMKFLDEKEDMKQRLGDLVNRPLPEKPMRKELFVDLTSLSESMNKMAKTGDVVHVDPTTKQWKFMLEFTDGLYETSTVVARLFLGYVGNVIVPPKPPKIGSTIQNTTGMTTRAPLFLVEGSQDNISTRSDELDSPDASRKNGGMTRRSNGDSGYQHSSSVPDSRGKFDRERYEENTSPSDEKPEIYTQSRTSMGEEKRGRAKRSTDDLMESGRRNPGGANKEADRNTSGVWRSQYSLDKTEPEHLSLPPSPFDRKSRRGTYSKPLIAHDPTVATYELRFTPTVSGLHKLGFKMGGYAVEDDAFTFYVNETETEGYDRELHFLRWIGEDGYETKGVKFPYLSLSEDRLNTDQCTITNSGLLIKAPSETKGRPGSGRFTNYCGTTGSRCFSGTGVYYWRVPCTLRVLAKVATFGKMILEVALAHDDTFDNSYCVWETSCAWSVVVSICSTHKSICIKAVHNSKVVFDKPLLGCEEGASLDLDLGLLLDLERRRLAVIDGQSGEVFWTFDDLDTSKALWPVFGVYNRYHFRVEVGIVSGDALEVPNSVSSAIEDII